MLNKEAIDLLNEIRENLHANPEVSEMEFETQKRILEFLQIQTDAKTRKIANTGVLAEFTGEEVGSTLLIRGDIDALPIQEINDFNHKSKNQGVSHKCGHDGHTTILLGLALLLSKEPIQKGRVILLFQPAEENGVGAREVLNDNEFQNENIDFAFALHNLPGYKMHQIVVKEKEFTSNVKSIIIKLNGKTAHAAEPEQGQNPALQIADLLQYAERNTKNTPKEDDFFLMTPVHVNLGDLAYGISAGYGEVHLTIRSWSTALMREKCEALEKYVKEKSREFGLKPEIEWTQVFLANLNDAGAVEYVRRSAKANQFILEESDTPFRWGEDFGLITQKHKGAMFGLGSGIDTPALHNPDYDFPNEIIPTGIKMFYQIINQIL